MMTGDITIGKVRKNNSYGGGILLRLHLTRTALKIMHALIQELLPNAKLDSYRNSLNFIILPDGGISNE